MAKGSKEKLGRGLDALWFDNSTSDGTSTIQLRISEIEPNRSQPRRRFDENSLTELADSIRQHGVLQPLMVRPLASGGYQIVAGERRWRACRMANITEVPAIVREMTDQEVMEIALIENLQREDLNIMEEAAGYQCLLDQYGMTQEQIAAREIPSCYCQRPAPAAPARPCGGAGKGRLPFSGTRPCAAFHLPAGCDVGNGEKGRQRIRDSAGY